MHKLILICIDSAYPTPFSDYAYDYKWVGTLISSSSNRSICITATSTGVYTYGPSHPPLPTSVTYPPGGDPFGSLYDLGTNARHLDPDFIKDSFSSQLVSLVFDKCSTKLGPLAARTLQRVSYLTESSVSYVRDDVPTTTYRNKATPTSSSAQPLRDNGQNNPIRSATSSQLVVESFMSINSAPLFSPAIPSNTLNSLPSAVKDEFDLSNAVPSDRPASDVLAPALTSLNTQPQQLVQSFMVEPAQLSISEALVSTVVDNNPLVATMVDNNPLVATMVDNNPLVATMVDNNPTTVSGLIIGSFTTVVGQSITIENDLILDKTTDGQTQIVVKYSPTIPFNPMSTEKHSNAVPQPSIISGQIITVNSHSQDIIDNQILIPSNAAISIDSDSSAEADELEATISQSQLTVGDFTSVLEVPPSLPSVLTIGDQTYSMNSLSEYVVGNQTLALGSTIIVDTDASPTVIALQTTNGHTKLIVGDSTSVLTGSSTLPSLLNIGAHAYSLNSLSEYIVGTQTLKPGATITVDADSSTTVIALQTINGQTELIVSNFTSVLASSPTLPAVLTLGTETYSLNSLSEYIVGSQTLKPGATITVDADSSTTVVALQTINGQTELVVGNFTSVLASSTLPAVLTLGAQTYSINGLSEYIVGTQILALGSSITIGSGSFATVIAMQTNNDQIQLVINSSAFKSSSATSKPSLLTIGSGTYTPDSSSVYIIADQTLRPGGPAITVSGTLISLAPQASALVVGTSSVQRTVGLGGYVWGGIHEGGLPTEIGNGTNIASFTGGTNAERSRTGLMAAAVGMLGFLGLIGWL